MDWIDGQSIEQAKVNSEFFSQATSQWYLNFVHAGNDADVLKITCNQPIQLFKYENVLFKRDVCKTVERTLQTANKINNDAFYSEVLIPGGFLFVVKRREIQNL